MIEIVKGNLFDSKANFIVHQVNCQGVMDSGIAAQVAERFPHVEVEYRKYLQHCRKKGIDPLGTVQYVPSEYWALILVNTIKNNKLFDYDEEYQYIVNLFGQDTFGVGLQTDLKVMEKAFIDIREKAKTIKASVAMPYKIGSCRGAADWDVVYNIIKNVFEKSDVDVKICKYDLE